MDNPGNFLNADDFRDDDNENEGWKPIKIHGKELFRKSIDILNTTQTICDLLSEDDNEVTGRLMMENASIIPAKIKGAMAVDHVYIIVMENAVIIKVNICQLKAQLWACKEIHGVEEKYTEVLKKEIEAFKEIFIKWVSCFDKTNDLPDDWHLFNNPADFPPDDEPFNPEDYFGEA
ncbi:MAG: hypothetical protein HYR66_02315 [Sphingobacteriales bacterium]|nr:hypothetical protein [Sphingobacteriales bacterium]MBI3717086.1 hypothetical protein [Sphingobacteriales bacterium]